MAIGSLVYAVLFSIHRSRNGELDVDRVEGR
jgi:hypothetical protein